MTDRTFAELNVGSFVKEHSSEYWKTKYNDEKYLNSQLQKKLEIAQNALKKIDYISVAYRGERKKAG